MPLCCCLVLFLLSCCVAALYTLKGDRVREGGWNTGLTIIPPSHQLTTPRLPTTPIHPTHHKYQETLKEKGSKVKKMTSKTWSKNDANSSKNGPGGARMHQKWSQNREKCAESPKVATRWLPRPLYPEGLVDFQQFLGPPWEPKNHQKSTFSQKSRPRKRFFIDFCCECRFPRFFD